MEARKLSGQKRRALERLVEALELLVKHLQGRMEKEGLDFSESIRSARQSIAKHQQQLAQHASYLRTNR